MALKTERSGAFAIWTIDRPETKNALGSSVFDALESALELASRDLELRAVILTGAGHTFASGGDLRELRGAVSSTDAERLSDAGRAVARGIARLDVPVIAALPGAAVGGGAELALACDMRIAEVRAQIQFKQARMGVTTAWGGLARLHALVGPGLAARLLLTGQSVSAAQAYAFGLVDAVAENGTSVATALAWAYDVAEGSPAAVAGLKRLLRQADGDDASLAREREQFVASWIGDDHIEAMNAYFARRAPAWKPRRPAS